MIQPAELTEGDRRRFLDRAPRAVRDRGVAGSAARSPPLTELVRRVRDQGAAAPRTARRVAQDARRAATPRIRCCSSRRRARATTCRRPRSSTRPREKPPPIPTAREAIEPPSRRRRRATWSTAAIDTDRRARACGARRLATETRILGVEDRRRDATAAEARSLEPEGRLGSEPVPADADAAQVIYARYLRSGRWVPVRVGALSLKGAALLAGALPRIDDQVDVALTYEGHRALVRGAVGKVSTVGESADDRGDDVLGRLRARRRRDAAS